MTEQIKNKVAEINQGKVPDGYKKTEVGIVPITWEETKLSKLFTFKNGLNKEKVAFGKGTPIVNYVDVWKKRGIWANDLNGLVELSAKERANYNVKKGDIFFTRTSETKDEIGLTSVMLDEVKDTVFSGFVLRARPIDKRVVTEYTQYCFSSDLMRHEVIKKSSITTRALTSGTLLGDVNINLPTKKEQQQIAEILMKWDEVIALQEKLIVKLEVQKKALMQRLLKPRKGWRKVKIGTLVKEKTTRNKDNCKNVLSVSNRYGFIKQEEQFSKQVASADVRNYKMVNKGDIAYNPSRINVGSIALYENEECGIVSPMYIVVECKKIDPTLLLLLLSTAKGKYNIETFLSGSVRDSLNYSNLAEIEVELPDDKKVDSVILLNKRINTRLLMHQQKLNKLKLQQKSLMQLLLTGIVRV